MRAFLKKTAKYLPIVKIAVTVCLLVAAICLRDGGVSLALYVSALVIIGVEPLVISVKKIFAKEIDENLLMVLASVGAFVLGEYAEGVLVLLLSAVGEYFERYAVNRSRNFVKSILDMNPVSATVLRGEWTEVFPEEVAVGETVIVKNGERVPLDGILLEEGIFDLSALTGESLPVTVEKGAEVASGSLNVGKVVTLRTVREYSDSTVTKILEMVENATSRKGKTEVFLSRFARVYTPIVVLLGVIVGVIPPLFDGNWSEWIYRALSFLVISCPCALVISVPLSFFRGIGLLSKKGILVKGSNYIEKIARVEVVAMDKTGTVTEGNFAVEEVAPYGVEREYLLDIADMVESGSNHPLARAISSGKTVDNAEYEEISGRGLRVKMDGRTYLGGNGLLMEENGVSFSPYVGTGSVIYFAEEGVFIGYVAVKDQIKSDSHGVKKALFDVGVKRIVMLSGDREEVCREVAKEVGITEYHAKLLPADKQEYLAKIRREGKITAYVGDGINDAPCLAEADVGIAMGSKGSDIAVDTADMVVMEDKLTKVADGIKISRRTVRIAKQNIVFSLAVKVAVMILSAVGLGNMILAIFADVGVTVLAILNAIRPYREK